MGVAVVLQATDNEVAPIVRVTDDAAEGGSTIDDAAELEPHYAHIILVLETLLDGRDDSAGEFVGKDDLR